jgi:hypothetical protein
MKPGGLRAVDSVASMIMITPVPPATREFL